MKGESLKEAEIAQIDDKTLIEYNDRIVTVLKKVTRLGIQKTLISAIYDYKYHQFVGQDLLNTVYQIRTKDAPKVKQLVDKGGHLIWQTM